MATYNEARVVMTEKVKVMAQEQEEDVNIDTKEEENVNIDTKGRFQQQKMAGGRRRRTSTLTQEKVFP